MQPRYSRICPKSDVLQLLGRRWSIPLILELAHGPLHFEKLRKGLAPVTAKTLSSRLDMFAKRGLVTKRKEAGPGFGRATYALTPRGYSLFAIMRAALCRGTSEACNGCRGVASCARLAVAN